MVVYCTGDNSGNRTQPSEIIYGNATHDVFRYSVDITANNMTIICGSSGDWEVGDWPGYVRVFSLVGGNNNLDTASWNQIAQDIIGEAHVNCGSGFRTRQDLSPRGGQWYEVGTD